MILRKGLYLVICFAFLTAFAFAQQNPPTRPRVVKTTSSQPVNQPQPTTQTTQTQRPTLVNKIIVVGQQQQQPQSVKKTGSTQPTTAINNSTSAVSGRLNYSSIFNQRLY